MASGSRAAARRASEADISDTRSSSASAKGERRPFRYMEWAGSGNWLEAGRAGLVGLPELLSVLVELL